MQEKGKLRYYIPRGSFGCSAGVVLLVLAVFFRLISYWGRWQGMAQIDQICYLALPISSALLMILCLLLLSRVALWTTALPVLLGAAFFVIKSLEFEDKLQMVLCVALCVLAAVLWCSTVFNALHIRLLLPPLFLLPFLYRMWVVDLPAMQRIDSPVSFADGMREMSLLGMLLAMFFISLGIRKRYKTPPASQGEAQQSEAAPIPAPVPEAEPAPVPEASLISDPVVSESELEPQSESATDLVSEAVLAPEPEAPAEKGGMLGRLFHRSDKHPAKSETAPEPEPESESAPEIEDALIEQAQEDAAQEPENAPPAEAQEEPEPSQAPETEEALEAEDTEQ